MGSELAILLTTAATIGFVHTLVGPDHYLPFLALASARNWSPYRTLLVTSICGIGHVMGSVVLGMLGIALGWSLAGLEWFEGIRGNIAGWLLLGFGIAYTAWGIRQAIRRRPHRHWHAHADGTVHDHTHVHIQEHSHVHASGIQRQRAVRVTPWVLFVIFVFGPCEALIPMLMYPAAQGHWVDVWLVVAVFGSATILTMVVIVGIGQMGVSRIRIERLEPYSHALAGLALVACGLAIQLGF